MIVTGNELLPPGSVPEGFKIVDSNSPMLAALVVGSGVALGSAVALASALGIPRDVTVALAPKSVTAAVAMGIAGALGGDPTLTAVLTILTGITGAILVRTASARPAPSRSARSRAPSPASPWG